MSRYFTYVNAFLAGRIVTVEHEKLALIASSYYEKIQAEYDNAEGKKQNDISLNLKSYKAKVENSKAAFLSASSKATMSMDALSENINPYDFPIGTIVAQGNQQICQQYKDHPYAINHWYRIFDTMRDGDCGTR